MARHPIHGSQNTLIGYAFGPQFLDKLTTHSPMSKGVLHAILKIRHFPLRTQVFRSFQLLIFAQSSPHFHMLRIGVLGAGHLGKIHLNCLQQLPESYELIGF